MCTCDSAVHSNCRCMVVHIGWPIQLQLQSRYSKQRRCYASALPISGDDLLRLYMIKSLSSCINIYVVYIQSVLHCFWLNIQTFSNLRKFKVCLISSRFSTIIDIRCQWSYERTSCSRLFQMDAYNLIASDVFTSLLRTYAPCLQFFEAQIVVYNRQTQRVILENPVTLTERNILPSTLKHLCLPLLADDSWITNNHLPHLEYLFFFGYTRSSGYALHENFLSIRALDYIAGNKSHIPNCPKIRVIEIALRQNDYYTIVLRPIIRKLFSRCKYLESIKLSISFKYMTFSIDLMSWNRLATAGNMDLAHSLSSSLYASNLQCCHVFAKDEGRPEVCRCPFSLSHTLCQNGYWRDILLHLILETHRSRWVPEEPKLSRKQSSSLICSNLYVWGGGNGIGNGVWRTVENHLNIVFKLIAPLLSNLALLSFLRKCSN